MKTCMSLRSKKPKFPHGRLPRITVGRTPSPSESGAPALLFRGQINYRALLKQVHGFDQAIGQTAHIEGGLYQTGARCEILFR